MNSSQATLPTKFKVGLFTALGLVLVGLVTVWVNDRPYWWRPCQLVHINVDDATGLKAKSPIRSLGLEIGYLSTVELSETHVDLGICITAPVEVLPSTRAYIRGEGFLGDKFVELKPVKYVGGEIAPSQGRGPQDSSWFVPAGVRGAALLASVLSRAADAQEEPSGKRGPKGQREIPVGEKSEDVQHLVNRVDSLVNEMTNLTTNLKTAINPDELRSTMKQLNRTLENASRTLSPEGGLNQTAQRTLAKLEDAIEQLRDVLTRVNKGEGSVGMLLNDPTYAEEIKEAVKNVNRLLSRVGGVRFAVDIGVAEIQGYDAARGWFRLGIWPTAERYYLLGVSVDPRGKKTDYTTTTTVGGSQTVTQTSVVEPNGLQFTAMLGKLFFRRIDLSAGVLNNDGNASLMLDLGPPGEEDRFQIRNDVYSRGSGLGIDDRATVNVRPFPTSLYFTGGVESFKKVDGKTPWFGGAGLSFNDDDIKLLFALR